MKLKYKTKRLLSLLILLFGLPLYAILVVTGMTFLSHIPIIIELLLYIFFGTVWVFPLKVIFRGVGQSDPND